MEVKFNNKENEKIETNNKVYWISRSVAVVGIVCLIKDNIPHFLIIKRGKGAADFHGMFCLPCGYLDWDENSWECFIREVYEESGIYVLPLVEKLEGDSEKIKFPIDVNTDISSNRQNVTIYHGFILNVDELPIPNIKNDVEEDEVEEVKWVSINDYKSFEFAFGHKEKIEKFINKNNL